MENTTLITDLIELQNDKLDLILLNLERLYYLGLLIVGVSVSVFVVVLFYNLLKKLF